MPLTRYSRNDDCILLDAATTLTSGTLVSSYVTSDILSFNPARRIRYTSGNVTIRFLLTSAKEGRLFALPMSNLAAGTTGILVTNVAGLSRAVAVSDLPPSGIPLTAVVDLGATSTANLVSSDWSVQFRSSTPLTLGGAIWLGGLRTLDPTLAYASPMQFEQHQTIEHENVYGVRLNYNLQTLKRWLEANINADAAGSSDLKAWYEAGRGRNKASVFWMESSVPDAYMGTWGEQFGMQRMLPNYRPIKLRFDEFVKGVPAT